MTTHPVSLQNRESTGISAAEARLAIRATGGDLADLFHHANKIRDHRTGRTITYSRKVFLPLTNLCRDTCKYCTFVRRPEDPLSPAR